MEFLIMVEIFSIDLLKLKIYSQDRFQKWNRRTNWIFFANGLIYFWNKLPHQIKNSNNLRNLKIKLDNFRNNWEKKNLSGYFLEPSDEFLIRI